MNARKLNGLEVTEVRIKFADDPLHPRLKAFAVACLNDAIMIRNLNVVQPDLRDGRMFVSFPSKVLKSGLRLDLAHPIDQESRAWIEEIVLDAYRRELAYRADWLKNTEPVLTEAC